MLTILLVAMAAALIIWWQFPKAVDSSHMGSVSERWLAEYRASHPS